MQEPMQIPHRAATQFAIAAALFLVVLCGSMAATTIPDIQRDFGSGREISGWVVASYFLAAGVAAILLERTLNRRIFLLALALVAAGSVASAAATTMPLLIGARVVTGVGAGAVLAGLARCDAFGTAGRNAMLAAGVALGAGPLISGVLIEAGGWKAPFAICGSVAMLTLLVNLRFDAWPAYFTGRRTDPALGILACLTAISGAIGMSRIAATSGDVPGMVLAGIGLMLLAACLMRAASLSSDQSTSNEEASSRQSRNAFIAATAVAAYVATLAALPQLLSQYHQSSATDVVLRLAPGALAFVLAAVAGALVARRAFGRIFLILGTWGTLAATLTLHFTGVDWSPARLSLVFLLLGTGAGMATASTVKAIAGAPYGSRFAGWVGLVLGPAFATASGAGLLTGRADATRALDPLFTGTAVAYSDALIVAVVVAAAGFLVAVFQPPAARKTVEAPAPQLRPLPRPIGPTTWALKPRAKPNANNRLS